MAAENGVSPSDASFLIAVVGVSNTAGRLLSGWMAGLSWTSPLGISISTTLVGKTIKWQSFLILNVSDIIFKLYS